jgi:2-keto-3-deoxy-6-phosphogluconate aldolase
LQAGAVALAVGGNLVQRAAVREGNWDAIRESARQWVDLVERSRNQVS